MMWDINRILALYSLGLIICQSNHMPIDKMCDQILHDCFGGRYDLYIPNYYTQMRVNEFALLATNATDLCDPYQTCKTLLHIDIVVCQHLKWCESNETLPISVPNFDLIPNDIIELSEIILDDLHTVCPYNNYCGRNATLKIYDQDETSCCFNCSCEPDCGLFNSCCFDYMDEYHIVEKLQLECNVITNDPTISVYMVNRCGNTTLVTKEDALCDSSFVIPVSSTIEKRVYINAECAMCNGVIYFQKWTTSAICRESTGVLSFDEHCTLQFYPPEEDKSWIFNFVCNIVNVNNNAENIYIKENISTENLNISNNILPKDIDMIKESYNEIFCKLLQAKFKFQKEVYENAYCFISNNSYIIPTFTCSKLLHRQTTKHVKFDFTFVLDYALVKQTLIEYTDATRRTSVSTTLECGNSMIRNPTNTDCVRIICPELMLKVDDECQYFAEKWMSVIWSLQLELTPKLPDTVKLSANLSINELTIVIHAALDLCLGDIKTLQYDIYINFEDHNRGQIIHSIVLKLLKQVESIDPNYLIQILKACLSNDWVLMINGSQYVFQSDMYSYKSVIEDGNSYVWFIIPDHNESNEPEIVLDGKYQFMANSSHRLRSERVNLYVTKTFFCEQVELSEKDVVSSYSSLTIRHNGVFLGDNEFIVKKLQGTEDQYVVKVCLDDYLIDLPVRNVAVKFVGGWLLLIILGMTLYHIPKCY